MQIHLNSIKKQKRKGVFAKQRLSSLNPIGAVGSPFCFLAVAEKITGNVVILLLLLSKSCVFGSQEASQIKIYPNFQKVDFWPKIEIKNATFDMFCTYFFWLFFSKSVREMVYYYFAYSPL